jgi:L-alanine-DL-glutamate epimerase-like enolase superfamily enzyme
MSNISRKTSRRQFLSTAAMGGAAASFMPNASADEKDLIASRYKLLDKALAQPVLKKQYFNAPVKIKSVDLLEFEGSYLCRVRSEDGAEGLSVAHTSMAALFPIFLRDVRPFFIDQDALNLDILVEKIFTYHFNFRYNGLAIGLPLATVEFAILDMLGKMVNKPAAELIGGIRRQEIGVYMATEFRELPFDQHFAKIKELTAKYDHNALKIKVGYLHSGTKDIHYPGLPGKSEKLVRMVREHYGDDFALYADSNGYYDVPGAIAIGKLLEEYKYGYFEEPVLYWHFEETKAVADALTIPIAHGEQDQSYYNFRWLLANDGIEIVEPDTYYFGGYIRSMRVALMAQAMGKTCVTHMSGGGLGFLYNSIFVSALPNPVEHHEFKEFYTKVRYECPTAPMKIEKGKMKVPTGPGMGVIIDPEFVAKHKPVSL